MADTATDSTRGDASARSMGVELVKFACFAAVTVAAALAYAVIDCVGYELVKKQRQR